MKIALSLNGYSMMYQLELNHKLIHQDLPRCSERTKIVNYVKICLTRQSFSQIRSQSRVATPRTTFPVDNDVLGGIRKCIFSRFASKRHHVRGSARCEWPSLCNNAIKTDALVTSYLITLWMVKECRMLLKY